MVQPADAGPPAFGKIAASTAAAISSVKPKDPQTNAVGHGSKRTGIEACDPEDCREWQGDSQVNDEKRGYENIWPNIGEVSNG